MHGIRGLNTRSFDVAERAIREVVFGAVERDGCPFLSLSLRSGKPGEGDVLSLL
jgi:hypothetical protein